MQIFLRRVSKEERDDKLGKKRKNVDGELVPSFLARTHSFSSNLSIPLSLPLLHFLSLSLSLVRARTLSYNAKNATDNDFLPLAVRS